MGSQKVSDETRTIFVVESEKNKTSSYAELFSGKYDIIKTKSMMDKTDAGDAQTTQ